MNSRARTHIRTPIRMLSLHSNYSRSNRESAETVTRLGHGSSTVRALRGSLKLSSMSVFKSTMLWISSDSMHQSGTLLTLEPFLLVSVFFLFITCWEVESRECWVTRRWSIQHYLSEKYCNCNLCTLVKNCQIVIRTIIRYAWSL